MSFKRFLLRKDRQSDSEAGLEIYWCCENRECKGRLHQSVRGGGGVVDNTLDYQSRGRKIDPPLLRSFG